MRMNRIMVRVMDHGVAPLLLIPSVVLLFVILLGPFLYMFWTAFTDLHYALPNRDGAFVGFENFRRLMQDDPIFWQSFWLTLKFVFGVVLVEFAFGLCLALLIFNYIKQHRIILTMLLVPMMLAPIAVGLIWKLLLSGDFGMFTYYLRLVGLADQQTSILGNPSLVMPAIMLIDVWQWTPFVTLVILAGLLSLPKEPFEAAIMDGARPLQIFRDVTLPLLRPIIALVLLLRGIDAFKEFDKVFILTGGGPGISTEMLSIYTFRINFRDWDLGYGAVCAFMVYLVVLIMCSVFYKAVYWNEGRSKPARKATS